MSDSKMVKVRLVVGDPANGECLAEHMVMLPKEDALGMIVHMNQKVSQSITKMLKGEVVKAKPKSKVLFEGPKQSETIIVPLSSPRRKISLPDEMIHDLQLMQDIKEKESTGLNPFENNPFFRNEKIVTYQCPECRTLTARRMTLYDDNIDKCRMCKTPVLIHKAIKTDIVCPNCNNSFYTYLANDLETVECKHCHSPIDVSYRDDKPLAKSLNLVR